MTTHDTSAEHAPDDLEARLRGALQADAENYTPDPDLEARIAERALTAPVLDLPSIPARRARLLVAAAAVFAGALVLGSLALTRNETTIVDMTPLTSMTVPGSTMPDSTMPGSTLPTAPTPSRPCDGVRLCAAPATTVPTLPPTTTVVPSAGATSTASTTASTAPPADPGRILRTDGLGDVAFGGSTAVAEQAVTARIGPPVARFTDPACGAQQIITWGSFAIWDREGVFTQWQLIGDAALGLSTTDGIGVGTSKVDIVAARPDADTESPHQPERFKHIVVNGATDESGWVAAMGADDRVVGMLAAGPYLPGCLGRDILVMALTPHARGLGILALGTPSERALTVLRTVYPVRSTQGVVVGASCSEHDETVFSDGDLTVQGTHVIVVSTEAGGVFRRWSTVAQNQVPYGLMDGDAWLTAGMTLGEIRSIVGERLTRDTSRGVTNFEYVISVGEPTGTGPDYVIDFNTTGDADSDHVNEIGAYVVNLC